MNEKEKEVIVNFVKDASDDDKMLMLSLMPHYLILNELKARLDRFNELNYELTEICHSMGVVL